MAAAAQDEEGDRLVCLSPGNNDIPSPIAMLPQQARGVVVVFCWLAVGAIVVVVVAVVVAVEPVVVEVGVV